MDVWTDAAQIGDCLLACLAHERILAEDVFALCGEKENEGKGKRRRAGGGERARETYISKGRSSTCSQRCASIGDTEDRRGQTHRARGQRRADYKELRIPKR